MMYGNILQCYIHLETVCINPLILLFYDVSLVPVGMCVGVVDPLHAAV